MFKNQVMNKMLCQSGYLTIVGEVSLPNSRVQVSLPNSRVQMSLPNSRVQSLGVTIIPTPENI